MKGRAMKRSAAWAGILPLLGVLLLPVAIRGAPAPARPAELEPVLGLAWYFVQLTSRGGSESFIDPAMAYGAGVNYALTEHFRLSLHAIASRHGGEVEILKDGVVVDYDTISIDPPPQVGVGSPVIAAVTTQGPRYRPAVLRSRTPIALSIFHLSLDLLLRFGDTRLHPFLKPFGIGLYVTTMDLPELAATNDGIFPGMNFGGGVTWLASDHLILGAEVKYHFVFVDAGEINGFTMMGQIGVRF
ncbi:MAG: hypothetical protein D6812_06470 [Deltaproteobacteria bacterium]|nr:MAG: hypothetical protein D6812_06470 [Deltaproteobacteria bacterium]